MTAELWLKIKNLFNKAIEFPEDKRELFLKEIQLNNNREIYDEVVSLIKSFEENDGYLEKQMNYQNYYETELDDLYLGKHLGPYRIESKIAEGGMGVVYLGIRVDEQFDKKVAIKLIKGGHNSKYILQRFQNEKQTLANLDHPNIAKLLDGGKMDDGNQYFIMEYIDGVPIDEYCDKNKLSINERLELFQRVCSAVQYAHQNLVIHRDIKPSNILVTKNGEPKLLDFGIAKILVSEINDEKTILTKTGFWNFTPEYASPEQVKGERVTTSSDVYSLGVLLYKLLSGHHPYKFPSYLPVDVNKIVCETNPDKPSTKVQTSEKIKSGDGSIKTLNPELIGSLRNDSVDKIFKRLSGDIDNIILMALRKEPERRYASVEQFAEDIKRHIIGLPVIARKDTFFYVSSRFIKRHKIGVAASLIIFLLFISGMLGIIWQANLAAEQRDTAKIEAAKSEHINSFLQKMLASPDPTLEGKDVKVVDILDNAVDKIDNNFNEEPEVKASIRSTIGTTYQNLGVYDKAIVQFKKALITTKILYGNNSYKTAVRTKNLAVAYHYEGSFDTARTLYQNSLNIFEKIDSVQNEAYAVALNDFSTLDLDLGQYDEAIKKLTKVISIFKEIYKGSNANIAAAFNNLALTYDYKQDYDNAEKFYRKALTMDSILLGKDNYELTHIFNNLAFIYKAKGDYQNTINMFERSYKIRKKLLPDNHPELAFSVYNLGCSYFLIKDYNTALKLLNSAEKIWVKSLPLDHPYFGNVYYWIGKIMNCKNKPLKGEYYLNKSLIIRMKKENMNNILIAKTECEIGNSLILQNNYAEAEKRLLKNFKIIKKEFGFNNEDTKYFAGLLEKLYTLWQKPEKAEYFASIIKN